MKRRIALLLSAAAVASTLAIFSAATPASATDTELCAGQGTAATGLNLTYPGLSNPVLTIFGFSFVGGAGGACVEAPPGTGKTNLTASGEVHGWCGLSTGWGSTTNQAPSRTFAWLGVGSLLIITGELVGVVNAVPNALAGESCVTGANGFLVQGVVILSLTS